MDILTINDKKDEKFLRKKTADFDFSKFSKKEVNDLVKKMREAMIKANGIGLAGNQAGFDLNFFVAQIGKVQGAGKENFVSSSDHKFYAIFNPEIIKTSKEKTVLEEGCLSVPGGAYGDVSRSEKITLIGYDKNQKKIKIKAWGLLARVFQHEVDHLNGVLFIDHCKELKVLKEKKND